MKNEIFDGHFFILVFALICMLIVVMLNVYNESTNEIIEIEPPLDYEYYEETNQEIEKNHQEIIEAIRILTADLRAKNNNLTVTYLAVPNSTLVIRIEYKGNQWDNYSQWENFSVINNSIFKEPNRE